MKYYGAVGFVEFKETRPGIHEEVITERNYSGDVIRNARRWQAGQNQNDDYTVNNRISLLCDPYAFEHAHAIRYVSWMSSKWKVSAIEVQYPRVILDLGGVYNEQ